MGNARYASHAVLLLAFCVGSQAMNEVSRRKLEYDIEERHSTPPPDHDANPEFPQTKATLLMKTPCRPEVDGYFGGTYGRPVLLQYGFLMETSIHGDIDTALQAIDEFVMDTILSNVFPEVCDSQRRLNSVAEKGRATGFKFNSETIDMDRSCQPTANPFNYCAVYSSTIFVFGRDVESFGTGDTVLGYARTAIENSLAAAFEYGVVRLLVDDELTMKVGGENIAGGNVAGTNVSGEGGDGEEDGFSKGAMVGLTISTLALVASIVGFFLYLCVDKKAGIITKRSWAERNKEKTDCTAFLWRLRACTSSRSRGAGSVSNVSLSEMESSLPRTSIIEIEDGKPVFAQFDPSISGSAEHSVTGSSGTDEDDPFVNSCLVEDPLQDPNDGESVMDSLGESEQLPDDNIYLQDPNDGVSVMESPAESESELLPDPDDDVYLEAFR